ncbi:MAG TPA: hypothetical protein VKA95_13120 [Nitrososphaeraceae archaeon]|nr:hypothetical protein [Nitrososphaeraceae archaeon]
MRNNEREERRKQATRKNPILSVPYGVRIQIKTMMKIVHLSSTGKCIRLRKFNEYFKYLCRSHHTASVNGAQMHYVIGG